MVGESAQGKVKSNFKRSAFQIHYVITFQPILTGAGKSVTPLKNRALDPNPLFQLLRG